jgi:hypothetical protein
MFQEISVKVLRLADLTMEATNGDVRLFRRLLGIPSLFASHEKCLLEFVLLLLVDSDMALGGL